MKPMHSPDGPARDSPQSSNGRSPPPARPITPQTCWKAKPTILHPPLRQTLKQTLSQVYSRSLGIHGNGPQARTWHIPVIARRRERKENTTANSCATRWCCAAARALHLNPTYGNLTAIFFFHKNGGSSRAYAWLMTEVYHDHMWAFESTIRLSPGSGPFNSRGCAGRSFPHT